MKDIFKTLVKWFGVALIVLFVFWAGSKIWISITCPEYNTNGVVETTDIPSGEEEAVAMIGSNSDPKAGTYFPSLSCSDLSSCTVSEVPEGYFTIGYTKTAEGCDWVLFNEGEVIDYKDLDEIHTYNNLLPLTALDAFVRSQTPWILSCNLSN